MRRFLGLALAGWAACGQDVRADETKHALDCNNTTIEFIGAKADGKHVGGFKKLTGSVAVDPAKVAGGKVEVEIDVRSLFSDNAGLTQHLKGADFFNVKKHPTAKFVSTKIDGDKTGFKMTGDFTLLGKTKSVEFPVTVTANGGDYKLASEFKINRSDYGMTYGKGKVHEEVTIKLAVKGKAE